MARRPTPTRAEAPAEPSEPSPGASEGSAFSSGGEELRQEAEGIVKRRKYRRRRAQVEEVQEGPSDDILTVQLGGMLRVLFGLGNHVAAWWGYEGDALTKSEAAEGAGYFLPLARKMPWLASLAIFLAGPVWLLTMIKTKFHRKAKEAAKAPEPPKPPADVRIEAGPFPRGA